MQDAHHSLIDDSEVIVDYNRQQLMPGWIPRRLGQYKEKIQCQEQNFNSSSKFNSHTEHPKYFIQQEGALGGKKNLGSFGLVAERDHFELLCMIIILIFLPVHFVSATICSKSLYKSLMAFSLVIF